MNWKLGFAIVAPPVALGLIALAPNIAAGIAVFILAAAVWFLISALLYILLIAAFDG